MGDKSYKQHAEKHEIGSFFTCFLLFDASKQADRRPIFSISRLEYSEINQQSRKS